ncbi:SDR family oxidoreductase [Sandaracinus amylolyticus]|uniref:SDR family oxidoreductase n=1 Tax=Sandaracinus amylolyticus TaxID=927083 RepID=UPI001F3807C7|nr:SDR family oxidoreductase [Sandaracinus amylolyticus]UJR81586.1 Short-chain alcohol dehydrogenase [Sandaracinus amylolyticus]
MSPTIFITGASTGLGRATALLFAERGWKVIATMRRPEDGADLASKPGITVLPLDVTDLAQIHEAARRAIELGGIDVLFNNAGYGLAGPLEGIDDAMLRRQIDTNLLGVIRTTQAFLPHFREKRAGVVITTTSIGGLATFPINSVYHATKWALEGWTESMSFELGQLGVAMKTVAPGGIKTDFLSRSLVLAQHPAYQSLVERVLAVFTSPERAAGYSTGEQIAEVVWEAATDGKDQVRYVAGQDAKAMYAQRLELGAEAFRKSIRTMFFG